MSVPTEIAGHPDLVGKLLRDMLTRGQKRWAVNQLRERRSSSQDRREAMRRLDEIIEETREAAE